MKTIVLFILLLLPLLGFTPCTRSSESNTPFAVFVGTSLCAEVARPLLAIPREAQCDRTKWNLALYVDPQTQKPTTYKLSSEYGYHVDNQTLLMKESNVREGRWKIAKGVKTNSNAVVYQLDPADTGLTISFQLIDPNLIHLLDGDSSMTLGNGAQSFTLSRIDPVRNAQNSASNVLVKNSTPVPTTSGSAMAGVFGGRTPCREVAQQLNHPVGNDCTKLKWELTLYQHPETQTPTTYKLRGTLFRDYDRQGTWTIVRGRRGDPNAFIFKLDPDKNGKSLLLFNADHRILFFMHDDGSLMVGNRDFSYTLNREK
jgi:hypothetical protein